MVAIGQRSRRDFLKAMSAMSLVGVALPRASMAWAPENRLSFIIDRFERRLYVRSGQRTLRDYDVAVGKPDHPTPTGSWKISRVDINPDWTPPDSPWSADREYKPPGHPRNPMGRARLVFDPPYSIHGTDVLDSLGRAASHGSVRVANPVALELAELLLFEDGQWQGERWFQAMVDRPDEMFRFMLDATVPIDIVDRLAER